MRILQILDVRWDSGIMRYGLSLAAALKERGHDVRVWALPGKAPFEEAQKLGLPVKACDRPYWRFLELRRDLQADPPDVVNAHSGNGHSLAAALNATLKKPFALVRTRGDARAMRPRPFNGWLWRNTQGFIAGNDRILEECRALQGERLPSRTVYWGMDWADPGPPEQQEPVRVGMVARLDPVKGHETLLAAAALVRAKLPDTEFYLAGPDSEIHAPEIKERAEALGIAPQVHVLGYVGRIKQFYRACHIGVIASNGSEAVSRAAVEWMASARPLVSTGVGCLPELVEDGRTGYLFASDDPKALAERLIALAEDGTLRERMGRAGRERYEARYRTETFAAETLKLYQDALHPLPHR